MHTAISRDTSDRDGTVVDVGDAALASMSAFRKKIWSQGRVLYRDLPWRNTCDPYEVLVSEVMLQQTQVGRVLGRWSEFLMMFPTIDALAASDSAIVLEAWQGLGYNRRALALKRSADICSAMYHGRLPEGKKELMALPGIGEATATGVRAFALNQPGVYLETNVRTVFIHEFFPDKDKVSDNTLRPLVEAACPSDRPRDWYYALLDYGAHLKQTVGNPSRKSAHYTRQSTFSGSRRQKRAELLRIVLAQPRIAEDDLFAALDTYEHAAGRPSLNREVFESILSDLVAEGFFRDEGGFYTA